MTYINIKALRYNLAAKVALGLALLSPVIITRTAAQNATLEDPSSYFASTNHDAYLDWLEANQASYTSNVFLPSLDGPENGAAVHWSVVNDTFYLAVAARATGWVGFGIAEAGGMKGADMVLFTSETDELTDAHVLDDIYGGPIPDACQSWTLQNSVREEGFLVFEATRLLDTQDPQDRPIFDDASTNVPPSRIIAAWGDTPAASYHGPTSRARTSIRFFGSTSSGSEDASIFATAMAQEAEGFIELRAVDYPVKQVETEYAHFCFSFADLVEQGMPSDTELHAIGIEPVIDPDAARFVHHLVVNAAEQDWAESRSTCAEFFGLNMAYVWAPGEGPFILPENVGAPLGLNSFLSFQLQIHYNNPSLEAGALDSSGVRFYYTSQKRQHDIGILQLGDPFVTLGGTSVGNQNTLNQHTFDCPSSCSNSALSAAGEVTVLREFLHMHKTGVRMYNRHIRGDTIIRDGFVDFFDFDQQGTFAVQQEPFAIKAGDSFQTSCYYKIDDEPTEFGLSSQEEMCMAFLFYYPRVELFGEFPYVCPALEDIPFCSGGWNSTVLDNPSQLERTFGIQTEACPGEQGTNGPNTPAPSASQVGPLTPTTATFLPGTPPTGAPDVLTEPPTVALPPPSSSGDSRNFTLHIQLVFTFFTLLFIIGVY